MAIFACCNCGHEGHFVEFKVSDSSADPTDDHGDEDDDEDELQCPACGADKGIVET